MKRIIIFEILLTMICLAGNSTTSFSQDVNTGEQDRAYTVHVLTQIAQPVLVALSEGRLKQQLPSYDWERDRASFAPLEAFGRTLAGIAPWLELGPDNSVEGKLRARYIELSVKSIINATDPHSPDYMNFDKGKQPLVDTAFFALGLLRAPKQLWGRLDIEQRNNVIAALKASRVIEPYENNWLLFSAMIEAALWEFTGECKPYPIEYAIYKHMGWYLGDGVYGDGPEFHWDYYNSYVIQPMLLEILRVCVEKKNEQGIYFPKVLARAQRYAVEQERLISPEGTFPVVGRSGTYRFGAFHLLSKIALLGQMPPDLNPGAVRSALTAIIRRMITMQGTFDAKGWLQVGAAGHQPSIREYYISSGSPYICLCGLVHLGLPEQDPFWTVPGQPWTQKKIWSGMDITPDHALQE